MFALTSWLTLSILGGILTLWAVWSRSITRWRLMTMFGFMCWLFLSGGTLLISQGWSSSCFLLLPGKYELIGYLPVPDEAIYLFLNTQYGPKTCSIPWDAGESDKLKKQQEGDGTEINVTWTGGGDKNDQPGDGELGPGIETNPRPKPPEHPEKEDTL